MYINGNIVRKSDFGLYAYSGSKLEAGMYIYTLAIGGVEVDSKRMILNNQ